MPETDIIPISASIASTGFGLRYIGSFCYSYGGIVSVTNSELPLFGEFTTGSGVIVADVQAFYATISGGDNYLYRLYLNDLVVAAWATDGATDDPSFTRKVVIPPFTKVKFTAICSASNFNDQAATFVGRVYGDA